jgi:hypothetical protein
VGEQIPKAAAVYDHFHLRLNFNTAVDEVRRQEWQKTKPSSKAIVSSD